MAEPRVIRHRAHPSYSPETTRALYRGSWRADGSVSLGSDDLFPELPRLIESGGVGLVWPRIRGAIDGQSAIALALKDGYRAQRERNGLVVQGIVSAVRRLREAGVEPVLVKGWAISHLYPGESVRPAGDIDLWVPPAQFAHAKDVVKSLDGAASRVGVDLHDRAHWPDRETLDFFSNSQQIYVGDEGDTIAVPCHEDHLRLLCLHFLGHGAHRPLWLCDISLLLEVSSSEFDWMRCLGQNRRLRGWISTVLVLAHKVLGANLANAPDEVRQTELPAWLEPALMQRWAEGPRARPQALRELVADPRRVADVFLERWPDPITATVRSAVGFTPFPRLPVQWFAYTKQIAKFPFTQLTHQVSGLVSSKRDS